MRIVTYDELNNPDGFLQLMEPAFRWAVHPDRVAEIRKHDPRFRDPYGFVLLQGRTPAGFVGVGDIPVRTRNGKVEQALGLHHVATLPACARKGIAARLFEYVEDCYRARGYRFSFLFTTRSLVAWHLYHKLGYRDLPTMEIAPRAHKLLTVHKKTPKLKHPKADHRLVEKLYAELNHNRYGFTARNPGWLKALEKIWRPSPGFVVSCRDGYALVENFRGALWIDEFLCRNREAYLRIVDRLLRRKPEALVDCSVWDPVLKRIYREQGFKFRNRTYGTLMAKPLVRGASIRSAFGPRFHWTVADQF